MKQTKISGIIEVIVAIIASSSKVISIFHTAYSTYTNHLFQKNIEDRVLILEKESNTVKPQKRSTPKAPIIIFTSFKGGVGTSTLTTLFCNHISNQYNILLIDAHQQLTCYNMRENDLITTPEAKPLYEIEAISVEGLVNHLDVVKNKYDYIVIDLPRFFYYEDNLESIFIRSNYIFAPFHIPYNYSVEQSNNDFLHQVEGRLDLFIELRKKIKSINKDITFTLVPYENDVTEEFKEWIEKFDMSLLPQTFKRYSELPSYIDTISDLCKNKSIAYAPYITNTKAIIYYLEKETIANNYIEEQNNLFKKRMRNILNQYKKR